MVEEMKNVVTTNPQHTTRLPMPIIARELLQENTFKHRNRESHGLLPFENVKQTQSHEF